MEIMFVASRRVLLFGIGWHKRSWPPVSSYSRNKANSCPHWQESGLLQDIVEAEKKFDLGTLTVYSTLATPTCGVAYVEYNGNIKLA